MPSFKGANGQYFTQTLFQETWVCLPLDGRAQPPVFSLHEDKEGCINARKTFVALQDPTGYEWAMQYLDGSYPHFQRLLRCTWFREAYESWLEELRMKMRVKALKTIREIASGEVEGTPQATILAAARYVAEAGWEKRETRGRPSKEELKGELRNQANILSQEREDMERIGLSPDGRNAASPLTVINGGKQ